MWFSNLKIPAPTIPVQPLYILLPLAAPVLIFREILSVRIPCKNRNEPKSLTFIHTSRAGASPRLHGGATRWRRGGFSQGSEGRKRAPIRSPCNHILLPVPSAAIVLPSTTSSHVNSGDRSPLKGPLLHLLIRALCFYASQS